MREVVFLGIFSFTRSQSFDDSVQQFAQAPQQFSSPQGRFPQPQGQQFAQPPQQFSSPQGQQFQNFESFNGQTSFNKAPDSPRIPSHRVRRPQGQAASQPLLQRPQPIASIPSPPPPPPPRAPQQFRQPQFNPPAQRQPVKPEFFDQPAPAEFSPPPPPQPQPQPEQQFVPRPTRIQDTFSTSKKTQKELEEDYNTALLQHQAQTAKYSFSASVNDGINDNEQTREEVRDGLKLTGKYSYSDGFYKRAITYEADENGYRVVNEEIEPLGDGPQQNPDGTAEVMSNVGGANVQYTISSADIVARKTHAASTNRSPQNTQQAFPSRSPQTQQAVEDTRPFQDPRPFTPSQPAFGRQQQQFQDPRPLTPSQPAFARHPQHFQDS